nr:transposase [Actinomyces trachealis]
MVGGGLGDAGLRGRTRIRVWHRQSTGPTGLLGMVEGGAKRAFQDWLEEQDEDFRKGVHVVAMDAFIGFKGTATQALPTPRRLFSWWCR